MTQRNYSNSAVPQVLTNSINTSTTSVVVGASSSYPTVPFIITVARGLTTQEVMLVTTNNTSTNTFTVTRAYDGGTAQSNSAGATVEHTSAAIDYREANNLTSLFTALGDLAVGSGSSPAYSVLHAGANGLALVADSTQPNGIAWEYLVPTGSVIAWAGSGAIPGNALSPKPFLVANGSVVSQTTYANLYSVLGTTYGPAAGGNFTLPQLSGATVIGAGTGTLSGTNTARTVGQYLGEEGHQLIANELAAHTHADAGHYHVPTNGAAQFAVLGGSPSPVDIGIPSSGGFAATASGSTAVAYASIQNNTTTQSAHNTMQPSTVMQYLIKT